MEIEMDDMVLPVKKVYAHAESDMVEMQLRKG
jgi:hypothetical protein